MDNELAKPYQKLQAVEEQRQRDRLLELYQHLYKAKYRHEPIFPVDKKHYKHIEDLRKLTGDKAASFMHCFFEMRDSWFDSQKYSLETLLRNVNKVATLVHKREENRKMEGKIELTFSCDACWKPFQLICDPNHDYINKPVFCSECKDVGKVKKVTKEEFKRAIGVMGKAFREVE